VKKTRKPKKPAQPRAATQTETQGELPAPPPEEPVESSAEIVSEEVIVSEEQVPATPAEAETETEPPLESVSEEPEPEVPPEPEAPPEAPPEPEKPAEQEPGQETSPREPEAAAIVCGPNNPCACKASRPKVPTAVLVQRHDTRLQRAEGKLDDLEAANRIILDRLVELQGQVRISYGISFILAVFLFASRLLLS
jgi:hypothetical protein